MPLVPVEEHLARILDTVTPLTAYEQPLLDAMGLPIAEDVTAPLALPSFDNSGMDGYAVVFRDVAGATEDRPVHLPVVGEIAAGQARIVAMAPGTAVRIMTGAAVPDGCTAVVPVEWTDGGIGQVKIRRAPEEGQHIRRQGEDVTPGETLMRAGELIRPRSVGMLAALGKARVAARPRPRVVVLSTGDELREPGQPLGRDSIYDANSFLLAAQARAAGAIAYRVGVVPDDHRAFAETLSDQLVRADVVVTSGGVSKGAYDIVKEVLSKEGRVRFDEVAMQPGKPQGFGVVGDDSTPIFTLPGNPVSSFVSFEVFVLPALRKMMGRDVFSRPMMRATCTVDLESPPNRRQYVRATYATAQGGATVTPLGAQGSHLIGDLGAANALMVVGERQTYVGEGTPVPVLVLDRDF